MNRLKNIPIIRFKIRKNNALIPIFVTFPDFKNLPIVNEGLYIYFDNGKPFNHKPLGSSFFVDFLNKSKIEIPKNVIKINSSFVIELHFKVKEKGSFITFGLVISDGFSYFQGVNFVVCPNFEKPLEILKSCLFKRTLYQTSIFFIKPSYKIYHIPALKFYKSTNQLKTIEYVINWDLENWDSRTIEQLS